MRKLTKKQLHDLIEALRHPSLDRVARVTTIVHVIYYGSAVIIPTGSFHIITSAACFFALLAELLLGSHKDK